MKNQYPFSNIIGVDVSKAKLDFAFDDDKHRGAIGHSGSIENSEEQIVQQLLEAIEHPDSTIVVKATGGYEELLVSVLHQHNIAPAVFLGSPRANNITGQTLNVDGGQVMHW